MEYIFSKRTARKSIQDSSSIIEDRIATIGKVLSNHTYMEDGINTQLAMLLMKLTEKPHLDDNDMVEEPPVCRVDDACDYLASNFGKCRQTGRCPDLPANDFAVGKRRKERRAKTKCSSAKTVVTVNQGSQATGQGRLIPSIREPDNKPSIMDLADCFVDDAVDLDIATVRNILGEFKRFNTMYPHVLDKQIDTLRRELKKRDTPQVIIMRQENHDCLQVMGNMENPQFLTPLQDETI